MKNHNDLLIDIMYNPISWIDDSYLALKKERVSIQEKALINELLIQTFSFQPLNVHLLNRFDKEIISIWRLLPEIFFLIGCYRFKAYLLSANFFSDLPINVKKFLLTTNIQMLTYKLSTSNHFNFSVLLNQAYYEMINFTDYLSEPVSQRLTYMFPQNLGLVKKIDGLPNFLLLRVASSYVKSKR